MRFEEFSLGFLKIDGVTFYYDMVIDRGVIRKPMKNPSKEFRDRDGHTPLSVKEDIPWKCRQLIVGTGLAGAFPVMDVVRERRRILLSILPTPKALELLKADPVKTNAVFHVIC